MNSRSRDRRTARQAKANRRWSDSSSPKKKARPVWSGPDLANIESAGVSCAPDGAERRRHPRLQAGA